MTSSLPGDGLVLVAGAMLAVGVASLGLAQRVRVPGLIVFLGLGMLLGSDGLGLIDVGFDDLELVQAASVAALVVILYEGGLGTSVRAARRVAAPAALLATVGVVVTATIVAVASSLIFGTDAKTSALVGAVVASTDAAAVFSVLRAAPIPTRLRDVLQLESGLNDPMAVLLTIGAIELWRSSPAPGELAVFGLLQLGVGMIVGLGAGIGGAWVLERLRLPANGAYPVLALGIGGLAYGLAAAAGGSGFLAVYLAGVLVADRSVRHRRAIRSFHDGLGSVAQIGLFLLLGLLVFPAQLLEVAGRSLLVALVLVLVARPLAVALCVPWFGFGPRSSAVVAWGGLRGAVPIVLATFSLAAGHPDGILVFEVVFFVVLVSALLQGLTVEPLARRLGLGGDPEAIDPIIAVLPFDRTTGELVELELDPRATVVGSPLAAVPTPDGTRIAAVLRGTGVVVPDGATVLEAGDRLLAVVPDHTDLVALTAWAGCRVDDEPR